jgi:Arc/MetJ family transcription regulator
MATNLALDDALIVEAQMIGHHKSKKDAVTAALTEYIQRHKQEEIIGLFAFSPVYDYKAARKSR